ncbi:MAG: hypothetical protein WAQ22_01725 [Candidatus Saccharimonas sp.]
MSANRAKRFVASSAAVAVAVVGLAMASVGTANAAPSGCAKGWATDGVARAECSYGSGQFRIGIPCKSIQTLGYGFTQYSPWVNRGQVAMVSCGLGAWIWSDIPGGPRIFLETRN